MNPNVIPWPEQPRRAHRPKPKPRGQHNLYLRGGIWWTRINEVRESTGLREKEIAAAKVIRDERLKAAALREAGVKVEAPLPCVTLGQLVAAYLEAESRPYDREKGGEQAGTKRSARTDRFARDRVLRHLDGKMPAADVTPETIIRLAEAILREPDPPAKVTRRKHLAFLRRVFSWAAERPSESGVRFSPFGQLTRQQRRELFPKSGKRGYIFTPEQLCGLYGLAKWRRPLIRFAAHTGMRFGELVTLRWACVNLEERVAIVEARYAKNGREREVPLGDVALGLLEGVLPSKPVPEALVFRSPSGKPIKSLGTWWNRSVSKVWKPSRPSERRPRFHDLRKTAGTRVEAVSSHAVAKRLLGHADEDVTDSYLMPTLEDVRAAVNRAAKLIDGEVEKLHGTIDGTVTAERA